MTIPTSAVLWTGRTSVVYVKQSDVEVPSFQFREVELGQQNGKHVTILKGLSPGEEIVTNGAFAIDAAAQLSNKSSMMNRNVTIKKELKKDVTPNYKNETPEAFKNQLDEVVDIYLDLKNDLVATDANKTVEEAIRLSDALSAVDMSLLKGDAHLYWMDQFNAIKNHGELIQSSTEVETQRKQFEFLSDAIIRAVEAFGTIGNTYYVQYCPMANDNQGANWISSEEQIRNPYFGDKMMKCGTVKRIIQN
jgi:Cu(I)/Ag(I) efflux system membrane fusion protein